MVVTLTNDKEGASYTIGIPFLRYLDGEGAPVATLPTWLDRTMLRTFYRNMVMVHQLRQKR